MINYQTVKIINLIYRLKKNWFKFLVFLEIIRKIELRWISLSKIWLQNFEFCFANRNKCSTNNDSCRNSIYHIFKISGASSIYRIFVRKRILVKILIWLLNRWNLLIFWMQTWERRFYLPWLTILMEKLKYNYLIVFSIF